MRELIKFGAVTGSVLLLVLTFGAGGAAAQDANITVGEPETDPGYDIEQQLGDLEVHSTEWINEGRTLEVEMSWRGDTPETVTIIEAFEQGSGSVGMQQTRVYPRASPDDRVSVSIDLRESESPVVVSTEQSLESGQALVLSPTSGTISEEMPVLYAVPIGTVLGAGGVSAAAIWRRREETGEPEDLEEAL